MALIHCTMNDVKKCLKETQGVDAKIDEITRACTYNVVLEEIARQIWWLRDCKADIEECHKSHSSSN